MPPHAQRFPLTATNIIAAITAVAWLLAAVLRQTDHAMFALGFIPARFSGFTLPFAAAPAYLTPLTATLVHWDIANLGFNLLWLVLCGMMVERVLGPTGIVILFIVGAYATAAAQLPFDPKGTTPFIGASGAISAIVGAYALSYGRAKPITSNLRLNRWINIAWLLAAFIVLQLMVGWIANMRSSLSGLPGHAGGFAAGLLLQRRLLLWRYRKA